MKSLSLVVYYQICHTVYHVIVSVFANTLIIQSVLRGVENNVDKDSRVKFSLQRFLNIRNGSRLGTHSQLDP